jgi:hypothetical protein
MNDSGDERRRHLRRHILKSGRIFLDDGKAVECVVRNVSQDGALLSLSNGEFVPDEFELSIDGGKTRQSAHAIWRHDGDVGVKFDLRSIVKGQVIAEAGCRCGVPTCRGLLALDLNPFVRLDDKRIDSVSNLIALCPACKQLHEEGAISRKALSNYKSCLVTLSTAFDWRAIDLLLFLSVAPRDPLVVSGDTVLTFLSLITTRLAAVTATTGSGFETRYLVNITSKGQAVVSAWKGEDLNAFWAALEDRLHIERHAREDDVLQSQTLAVNVGAM